MNKSMNEKLLLATMILFFSQVANPLISKPMSEIITFSKSVDSFKKQLFKGDFSLVQEVLPGEYAITSATSSKPVLATCGLGPCVSLAGYNKTYKVAFLTHYRVGSNVLWSYNNLVKELLVFTNKKAKFELTLVGGEKNYSEGLINIIKSKINSESRLEMSLIEEDTLDFKSSVSWATINRTNSIDSRIGKTYAYDPFLNPHQRTLPIHLNNYLTKLLSDKLVYHP